MKDYEKIIRKIAKQTGTAFRPANATSIEQLRKWNLPQPIIDFYSYYEPEACAESSESGLRLWPISDLVVENEQGVPGICVRPFGYIVFASTMGGDAYCFNLNQSNDGEPTIGLVSHESVGEDSTADEVHSMVKPIASSLSIFLDQFAKDKVDQECIYPPFP